MRDVAIKALYHPDHLDLAGSRRNRCPAGHGNECLRTLSDSFLKLIMKKALYLTAVLGAAVFLLLNSGCTQIERDGFSPIPQNTPASWELNPYGTIY